MFDWIYSIGFDVGGLSQVSQATATVEKLDASVEGVGTEAEKAGSKLNNMGSRGVNGFDRMRSAALRYLSVGAMIAGTMTSITAAADFDSKNIAIDFATQGNGAQSIEFVRKVSDELGVSLQAGREGYLQLAGAVRGTPLEGQAANDLFEGVAMAGGAMKLTEDQMKGAYLAIGQIASKGKLQAEELRGQLGERIPGAFKIAADAMGVTQSELNKMLETGQVVAEDFLPKFASQLKTTFAEGAAANANTASANMSRFSNEVLLLKVAFGEQLLPVVNSFLSDYLIPSVGYVAQHIGLFTSLAAVIGGVWLATKAYAIGVGVVTLATQGWTIATAAFNIVMGLNPIMIVVSSLALLAGGIVLAWSKFAGFRGFIMGMWSALKETGKVLYERLIQPFMSFGKVIVGIFTLDKDMILSGIKDGVSAAESWMSGDGASRINNAFAKGYNDEVAEFNAGKLAEKDDALSKEFANSGSGGYPPPVVSPSSPAKGVVSSSGQGKGRNVNISLQNLVGTINITSATVEAGADELVSLVERKLIQALNTANSVQ